MTIQFELCCSRRRRFVLCVQLLTAKLQTSSRERFASAKPRSLILAPSLFLATGVKLQQLSLTLAPEAKRSSNSISRLCPIGHSCLLSPPLYSVLLGIQSSLLCNSRRKTRARTDVPNLSVLRRSRRQDVDQENSFPRRFAPCRVFPPSHSAWLWIRINPFSITRSLESNENRIRA